MVFLDTASVDVRGFNVLDALVNRFVNKVGDVDFVLKTFCLWLEFVLTSIWDLPVRGLLVLVGFEKTVVKLKFTDKV